MRVAQFVLLAGLMPALVWSQEVTRRLVASDDAGRVAGVGRELKARPGTHVQRIGEWGVPGKVQTRIVTGATRGTRRYGLAHLYDSQWEVQGLASADFNSDGFADIAVAGEGGVLVRPGKGNGELAEGLPVFESSAAAIATADFDGDGHIDLAIGTEQGVAVLYGSGDGTFARRTNIAAVAAAQLLVADWNLDSIPDLAVAGRKGTDAIEIHFGDGSSFRPSRRVYAGAAVSALAAADFDRDGNMDIAAALTSEAAILVWRADNDEPRRVAVPSVAFSIGVLDQGAAPHLLARFRDRAGTHVLANRGNGTFAEAVATDGVVLDAKDELTVDLNNDMAEDRVFLSGARQVTTQPLMAGVTALSKSHTGTWSRGDFERMFTINVSGSGNPTITDTPPAGLKIFSAGGAGWECIVSDVETDPVTCQYLGSPVSNGAFPPIRVFADISQDAPNVMVNRVSDGTGVEATDTVVLGTTITGPDLAIDKTHTGAFIAGGTATYTLTVSNVGTATSSGLITVTEIPPASLTVGSMNGNGWTCSTATLQCTTLSAVAPGGSLPPITVSVIIAANAPTLIANEASVAGGGDTNTANNQTGDLTTIVKPDLSINKTHSGNFRPGQVGAQFTITVTNVGTSASSGTVTVTDTLPGTLTATALSGSGWNCSLSPLQCTRADALAAGASYPNITLTVNVSDTVGVSVINQVTVAGGGDSNPLNNAGADIAAIDRIDLTITKTHSGSFPAGTRASYSIVVNNVGQLASSGTVTVTDNLPAALTNAAMSGAGWTCQTTPTLSCSRADALAPGASYPAITMAADVVANPPASFTNTATVSGGGDSVPGNNTASDPTSSQGTDLTVDKTHLANFSIGQAGAEWTITVTNVGGAASSGEVRVTDFLTTGFPGPVLYTFQSIGGTGWTCPNNPAEPYCTRTDSLAPGASYPPITVRVNITSDASATQVSNHGRVAGGGDTNSSNNDDIDTVILARPDLAITKTHTGNFRQNQSANWTINVSNVGSGYTSGEVRVNENPQCGSFGPTYCTVSGMIGSGWACTVNNIAPYCTRTDALAPGASYPPITVNFQLTGNAPPRLDNVAHVVHALDTNSANNNARDTATVDGADFTVTKSHTGNFLQGQPNAQYTLTVTNNGTASSSGSVAVRDDAPADAFTNLRMSGTGWTCTANQCTRSDALAAGASYPPVTVLVDVLANAPANVINYANLSVITDSDVTNNGAEDPTTIGSAAPDLAITKTHTGNFRQNQSANWTISVSNVGSGYTSGEVRVNENPQCGSFGPTYCTVSGMIGSGWACTVNNIAPYCTRTDALAPGASYPPITVNFQLTGNAPPRLDNVAHVVHALDTNSANNNARDTASVDGADFTVTKSHVGNFLQGQPNAQYTLTVTNNGTASSSGSVAVRDDAPADAFTNLRMSGTGWTCTANQCTRSDALAAGASYPPVTVLVDVLANAPANVINYANLSVITDSDVTNNGAEDPTTIGSAAPDLAITKTHTGNFRQSQSANWTINVSNVGSGYTSGEVRVNENPQCGSFGPTYCTVSGMIGSGWACTVNNIAPYCTRTDALAPGASYPPITVNFQLTGNAPPRLDNVAHVVHALDTNSANNNARDTASVDGADFTVTKSHTGNFLQGQPNAQYTLTVTNNGTASSSGSVAVRDDAPADAFTNLRMSGTGWTCTANQCTRSDALAAGASYPPVTVLVDVLANAPANVINYATLSVITDSDVTNNNAQDPTTIESSAPDLAITKTHTGNFRQSQSANWTINVSNVGSGYTSGEVRVNENPQCGSFGPTYCTVSGMIGSGWACTVNNIAPYCTRTDALAPGASYPPITVNFQLTGNAPPRLDNVAHVVHALDTNTTNNNARDTATVDGADFTVTKSHVGNFLQGQPNAQYTLTVTNNGTASSSGSVAVRDDAPADAFTNLRMSGTGWTCTANQCTRSDALAAGASYPPVTVLVDVLANAPANVINYANLSVITDSDVTNNGAEDPTTIGSAAPDLAITKTHTGNFRQSQSANWTINVSNVGSGYTSGEVRVNENPQCGSFGPTYCTVSGMIGSGWACTVNNIAPYCTRTDALAPGASYPPITVNFQLTGNAPARLDNVANVVHALDTNTTNNNARDTATVDGADFTLTKSHVGNLLQGQPNAQYTLTVTNNGTGASSGSVSVTDNAPADAFTNLRMSGTGWTCTANQCTRSDALAAGASYPPVTVLVDVLANAPANVINYANVAAITDSNVTNNGAQDPTTIAPVQADLTVTKSHNGPFRQGQVGARYTITVSNRGPNATVGQVAVDELPPANAFTSLVMSGTGWSCAAQRCTRTDSLAAGSSYPPITVTVNVSSSAPTTVMNRASVSGPQDTDNTNNVAADATVIQAATADLRINKSHAGTFTQGQSGSYTISVTNIGVADTSGTVTVVDILPSGLTASAIAGAGWTCTLATRSCSRSDALAPATSYPPITITVDVASNAAPNVVNIATVSGGNDSDPTNNAANDPTVVNQTSLNVNVTLGAVVFNRAVNRYQQIVTVQNNGANLAAAALVLDSLSAGASLIAPDGVTAATAPAGSPYRELGPIPSGGAAVVTLQFTRAGAIPITYSPRILGPGPR